MTTKPGIVQNLQDLALVSLFGMGTWGLIFAIYCTWSDIVWSVRLAIGAW